jgi:hypothetical protein
MIPNNLPNLYKDFSNVKINISNNLLAICLEITLNHFDTWLFLRNKMQKQ